MKDLDLVTLGLEEMNEIEVRKVEGGWVGIAGLVLGAAAIGIYCYDNRDQFKAGFMSMF